MKKMISILAFVLLILGFTACGNTESPDGKMESAGVFISDHSDHQQEEANTNVSEQTEDGTCDENVASNTISSESSAANGNEVIQEDIQADTQEDTESMLQMRIGDTLVAVEWEDNASVQALRDLCPDAPLTIQMSMYGGFEQVGSIGESLPRNDAQTTAGAGDIVLYSGNQIVVFYGSNSWAYTRLGHITDQDAAGIAELLGNGDVTITISME